MSLFRLLSMVFMLVGVGPVAAAPFTNGGFDTGALSPWSEIGGNGTENWNVTGAVSQSGGFSATNIGNAELRQTFTPFAAGTVAILSFWIQTQSVGQLNAIDLFYVGGQFTEFDVRTTTAGFNFFDETLRVDPTRALSGFGVYGSDGARTYLDTVIIAQAMPEAASLALLAGFVACAVLARAGRARRMTAGGGGPSPA